jgi:hypothetical protein
MQPLDGHYRHGGAAISWDDDGVTLSRANGRVVATAPWTQIDGARQLGGRPGFVQLLVQGHVPPTDPRHDPFSIAVNSDEDANRLVISIGWRGTPTYAETTIASRRSRSWLRPRARARRD